MGFQKAHGLTIAQNGYIENMVSEQLSSDPTVVEAGRFWFNTTEKLFKFSTLNVGGTVVIKSIKDKEDYDSFITDLTSQAADNSGSTLVGYDGQSGTNGQFSLGAGNLASALDSIITQVDQTAKDLDDAIGGGEGTTLASLQTELDTTQGGAGLGVDGLYAADATTNYLTGAITLKDADKKLDTQAKAQADSLVAEINARAVADDLKVDLAGDTMGGNLDFAETYTVTGLAEPNNPSDAATKNYVDAFAAGLDPKESSRCTTTENIDLTTGGLLTLDGVNVAADDRVLVKDQTDPTENGVYRVVDGSAWIRTLDMDGTPANEVSGGTFCFVEEGALYQNMGFVIQWTGNVILGTDPINWVQFSGAGQVVAGAGIAKTGNELYLKFGAGIIELPSDEIGIDLYGPGGLFLTEDGVTDSAGADAEIGIKLAADGTLHVDGNGLRLSDVTKNTLTSLQTELDSAETGAGLGTGGTYSAQVGAAYISTATSLFNADVKLDAQVKINEDGLSQEVSDRTNADSLLQTELDATQLSIGLGTDGTYTAPASNYLGGSSSVVIALGALDTAAKSNEDGLSQEVSDRATAISTEQTARSNADTALATTASNIQTELDSTQAGAGLNGDGTYTANGLTNYITGATGLTSADNMLDAAIKSVSDDLQDAIGGGSGTTMSSLQIEIDNVEAAMGTVIGADGTYSEHVGSNYLGGNTTVAEDLMDLDSAIKVNATGLAAEIVARGDADGVLQTNIGSEATARTNADATLQDNITAEATARTSADTLLQNELNATQGGAGLGADGAYAPNGSANYISLVASLKGADDALDTSLKTEETARINADNLLQTEVDAFEAAMGAVITAAGAYQAFNGTNYINSNATLTEDLTDLDAAVKTNYDSIVSLSSATASNLSTAIDTLESGIDALVFTFTAGAASTQHVITHNLATEMVDVTVWVKDDDLKYRNDLVGVTVTDNNSVTIDLTESRVVRAIVRSTAALA